MHGSHQTSVRRVFANRKNRVTGCFRHLAAGQSEHLCLLNRGVFFWIVTMMASKSILNVLLLGNCRTAILYLIILHVRFRVGRLMFRPSKPASRSSRFNMLWWITFCELSVLLSESQFNFMLVAARSKNYSWIFKHKKIIVPLISLISLKLYWPLQLTFTFVDVTPLQIIFHFVDFVFMQSFLKTEIKTSPG